ncbi:MAG: hypothetical protein QOJ02_1103 [Acidobacteriota bacterium]|jgi:hypothetical protein|nr:hypothetical protein [Acidobacteriota bacterium]
MNKKRILLGLCLFALALGSLAWAGQRQSARSSHEQKAQEQAPEIPDQIAYLHLFRRVAAFKKKAVEVEREGKDNSSLKTYFKRQAELNDTDDKILGAIASECNDELMLIDAKAKAVIDAFKAQYPGGRVPHGELPKSPPAELRAISEERDAIVLRYRDLLRASLGENKFSRFHNFVKRRIAPNISPQQVSQLPSTSQPDAQ